MLSIFLSILRFMVVFFLAFAYAYLQSNLSIGIVYEKKEDKTRGDTYSLKFECVSISITARI